MAKIVTVEQMRRIERAADAAGWTYDDMMRRAGRSVAEAVLARLPQPADRRVLILVGAGNNGGDGLVAGGILRQAGMKVTAYLFVSRPQPDPHAEALHRLGGDLVAAADDPQATSLERLAGEADVILDAVLGTGIRLPLREEFARRLRVVDEAARRGRRRPLRVAVDCPTGLDCDSGAVDPAVMPADLTVTLAAAKPGLFRFPGAALTGEVVVGDIGLDPAMKELSDVQMELTDPKTLRGWLPARPPDAHKGTFGTVLIAGGSVNYPGSVALAGEAAYRVGAGLVTLAVPGAIHGLLVPALPEATWLILPQETGVIAEDAAELLRERAGNADVIVVGPGMGREETSRRFLERLLDPSEGAARGRIGFVHRPGEAAVAARGLPPLVVDADALRLLREIEGWHTRLPSGSIVTPHPGEMSALTGLETATIQANREGIAREKASEWGVVVVLKGAHTVIAAPDGRAYVLPFATAALAKAGTGDVLAGAIGGLRAQGLGAVEAAVLGAYAHGRAGVLAAEEAGSTVGVLAGEVALRLPEALAELQAEA